MDLVKNLIIIMIIVIIVIIVTIMITVIIVIAIAIVIIADQSPGGGGVDFALDNERRRQNWKKSRSRILSWKKTLRNQANQCENIQ